MNQKNCCGQNCGHTGLKVTNSEGSILFVYEAWHGCNRCYIADFYCSRKKWIVELDGACHNTEDQKEYYAARDLLLKRFGLKILRIKTTS
ncbi:MAG: hypothetical protein C4308_05515 [Chitinophagaceae bacterium]